MAKGASNTLTKELRIELKFVTTTFLRQTRIAARALDILNNRFERTKISANSTGDAFTQLAREAREVSSPEITEELKDKSRALSDVATNANKASTALNKYTTSTAKAEKKTAKMKDNIKKSNTELNRLERGANSAKSAIGGFAKAAAGAALLRAGSSIIDLTLEFERVTNRMKAATNSNEEFNDSMRFASSLANQLGVDLVAATRGYATLIASTRGSGVEGGITNDLFESIIKASSALSLTADETNSVILAFGQVASKGRAAAEEIRGQIGERIPGFYTKLAEALGKTQAELTKLLDQGLLSSDQALEASARALDKAFGESATENAKSIAASWLRIKNLIVESGVALGQWALENSILFKLLNEIAELRAAQKGARESTAGLLPNLEKEVNALTKKINRGALSFGEYNEKLRRVSAQYTNIASQSGLAEEELVKFNNQIEKLTGFAARTDFSKRLFTADSILRINKARVEAQRLEKVAKQLADKEKTKAATTFFNAFNKGFSLISQGSKKALEEISKLPDPANKLALLTDEQKSALAEQSKQYVIQKNADKDRLKSLQEQLNVLKQQKEALKGGTGRVNFIEAIQAGSAASIKVGIEARSRALGAVDSNKEILKEIDMDIKRTNELIEQFKEKVEVESV